MNIIRRIRSADRMEEIIKSMRHPIVGVALSDAGIPDIVIIAQNKDGVCKYIHKRRGFLNAEILSERFTKYVYREYEEPQDAWMWKMEYCKKNNLPPAQDWAWDIAGKAYQEQFGSKDEQQSKSD